MKRISENVLNLILSALISRTRNKGRYIRTLYIPRTLYKKD